MKPECGTCRRRYQETPLLCPHCANFLLLRPRLEYLDALGQSLGAKQTVDSVLDCCIKGHNFAYVSDYVKSANNGEDTAKDKPSKGAIAALSTQLLTIDAIIIKRKNNKIQKEINSIRTRKEEAQEKLNELKKDVQRRKAALEAKKGASDIRSVMKDLDDQRHYKEQDNRNVTKQINNSRSLLFQELINIYIIRKRKISGTAQTVLMLSFSPILSASTLADFNYETINGCLEKMCKFIHQVSKVLLVILPYRIHFDREKFYRPSIMKFELYLDNKQVRDLSTFSLRLLANGLARLTVDVHLLLRTLELDDEIMSYADLLRLDEMIYRLAYNDFSMKKADDKKFTWKWSSADPEDTEEKDDTPLNRDDEIDVEKLSSMVFKEISSRINSKNNEWHVVRKEYLVDDE